MHRVTSLNGLWNFKRLALSTLEKERVALRQTKTRKIRVPANWWLEGEDFAGEALYERTFAAPRLGKNEGAVLEFRGSDYFTRVELNGRFLGEHEGYFQTFFFDASHALASRNRLRVFVFSPKENKNIWPHAKVLIKGIFNHHDTRPGSWDPRHGQDANTGGLWGGVFLHRVDHLFIPQVRISPKPMEEDRYALGLRFSCWSVVRPQTFTFDLQLEDPRGAVVKKWEFQKVLVSGRQDVEYVVEVKKPYLWWPWDLGRPNLYTLQIRVFNARNEKVEEKKERFGFRHVQLTSDYVFFVNGRRFFPRGTNIIPTQWLSEYTREKARRDVALMRRAHLNAVRVHAHVNRREFYEACDEAGLFVWQDFALQWSYDGGEAFKANARRQIREMVRDFYNHPSIGVWCCHNEPSVNRKDLDPLLADAAREEDSLRPVEEASDFHHHPYPGWYWSDSKVKELHGHFREAPLVSEYGAQALPSVRGLKAMFRPEDLWPPNFEKWAYHDFQYAQTFDVAQIAMGDSLETFVENSQTYQARLLKHYTETLRMHKDQGVNGYFQFMFVDDWPSITWSVVEYDRTPKKGYFALAKASQPLLPIWRSNVPRRRLGDTLNHGGALLKDLIIVNDYPKDITGLRVRLEILDPAGRLVYREEKTGFVPAQSVTKPFDDRRHFGDLSKTFRFPKDGEAGVWKVKVFARAPKEKIQAENEEEILVSAPEAG